MATKTPQDKPLRLIPGRFYRSRTGAVWCCFGLDPEKSEHAQADCVRVSDGRIEYFFPDGRYDEAGKREHTLIAEVSPDGSILTTATPASAIEEARELASHYGPGSQNRNLLLELAHMLEKRIEKIKELEAAAAQT